MAARLLPLLLPLLPLAARADMYDVVEPAMAPPPACALGCATWSDLAASHNSAPQAAVDALWASAAAQRAAGRSCAMPARFAGQPEASVSASAAPLAAGFDFSYGPQCYCAGTAAAPPSAFGYCADPAVPTPQQVNLQFGASEHELSVSFVTLDNGRPFVGLPLVELCSSGSGGGCVNVTGSTARMAEPQNPARVYSFHLVTLPAPLAPSTTFAYRVRGNTADSVWRGGFAFTTRAAAAAPTRFGVCGDLGPYSYSSNGNLLADASLQFFIHLGDHAYNMAMGGGARGDAYMIGMQPVLSEKPWLSVIGKWVL